MTLLDLLTYRGTLLVLNGIVLIVVGPLVVSGLISFKSPEQLAGVALVVPYALAVTAFARLTRPKALLIATAIAHALLLLLSLPFLFFSGQGDIAFAWFAAIAAAVFVVPIVTITACLAHILSRRAV